MRRRVLEWSWLISFLLSIGCVALYADSLLSKSRHVLSVKENVYLLVADGQLAFFRETGYAGDRQPRVLNPRGFGSNHKPNEHAYFDWRDRKSGVGPCFVTGMLSFPTDPVMRAHTIRYTEFTLPGLSYHWSQEPQLTGPRWEYQLSLLIPLLLLLFVWGLSWKWLRKSRSTLIAASNGTSPASQARSEPAR
jgi:hypothetical protein